MRDALARLAAVVPATRALLDRGDVRLGAYVGPKLDHPAGAPTSVVGDAGLENLRHVCPVLFGLAMPAAKEVLRQLEATEGWARIDRARRPLDPRARALPGVEVAVEQRLSREQRWYEPAELRRALRIE